MIFSEGKGQEYVKRALEIAAAGSHNIFMLWSQYHLPVRVSKTLNKSVIRQLQTNTNLGQISALINLLESTAAQCLELPTTCSGGYYSVDSNLTSGTVNGGRSRQVMIESSFIRLKERLSFIRYYYLTAYK